MIGFLNSQYDHQSDLSGKIDAVEEPLREFSKKIEFETFDIHLDLTAERMKEELEKFADFCYDNEALVVFFYCGGHGIHGDSPILLGTDGNDILH